LYAPANQNTQISPNHIYYTKLAAFSSRRIVEVRENLRLALLIQSSAPGFVNAVLTRIYSKSSQNTTGAYTELISIGPGLVQIHYVTAA